MDDFELLRRYEPILCFTDGEFCFPMSVGRYIERSSLWCGQPDGSAKLLVSKGSLNTTTLLTEAEIPPEHTLFMRFVDRSLDQFNDIDRIHTVPDSLFRAPSRLARVGLIPRLADAVFSLSLLLRGTVPGDTTAHAIDEYRTMRAKHRQPVYHGRVIHDSGYLVLHYMFFYAMNDWRSSFHGANDHEADWEQLFVILDETVTDTESPVPAWIACAAHDESGDNLRRRWDDPDLTMSDNHPVVFIGAGSHAAYFQPGEYLTPIELGFMRPLLRVIAQIERVWRKTLRQGSENQLTHQLEDVFRVPFVDYARGDGTRIGPGQAMAWAPCVVDDETGWVNNYRGLWGLDTRDRFGGERAPAGPKYNRDGTVRLSWYDPLAWSGLDKVPPSGSAPEMLRERIQEMEAERDALSLQLADLRTQSRMLELEVGALSQDEALVAVRRNRQHALEAVTAEAHRLSNSHIELVDRIAAGAAFLQQLLEGERGDPRAHITHLRAPQSENDVHRGIVAETWAALSIGLLLLFLAADFFLGMTRSRAVGFVLAVAAFVAIDAAFNRQLER